MIKYKLQIQRIKKYSNQGGYLLQQWNMKCNDKINRGKILSFRKSSELNTPTGSTRPTCPSPIGDSFLYVETSSNIHGTNVYFSFERTDILQLSEVSFCYKKYLGESVHKGLVRLRIQLVSAGLLDIIYLKSRDIVLHQLIGQWLV